MAQFVIKGEHTARGDTESLCTRCTHAHIYRGQSPSQERVSCEVQWHAPKVITWHITKCSGFSDRTLPSLLSYEKIAWHISADGPKNKVGFLSPSQYKEKMKQEGDNYEDLRAPWEQ